MMGTKVLLNIKSILLKGIFFLLLLVLSFSNSENLFASGGFGGGVSQIPKGTDREKYHIGKAIYNNEIELSKIDTTKEVEQKDRLEYLQGSLPNSEKKRVNLLDLSGKLTNEQLNSLEYFLTNRFNIKLDKK